MSGVATVGAAMGLPAIRVLRLEANRPLKDTADAQGAGVVLTAVTHPPRVGEVRPIAALLSDVLARYGLAENVDSGKTTQETSIDLLA
jgi:hypothetical protein